MEPNPFASSSTIDSEGAKKFLEEDLDIASVGEEEKESMDIIDIILSPTRAIYYYLNGYYYGFNLMKEIQMGLAVGTVAVILGLLFKAEPFKIFTILLAILFYILTIVKINSNGDKRPFREIVKEDLSFVKQYEDWVNTDSSVPKNMLDPKIRNQYYKEGEQVLQGKEKEPFSLSKFFSKFRSKDSEDEIEELEKEYLEHNENN